MDQSDPHVTAVARLMRKAFADRAVLRRQFPFTTAPVLNKEISRKSVVKVIFDRLKQQYSSSLTESVALQDAKAIEAHIHARRLYSDVAKMKEVISLDTRKYAAARNKRVDEQNRIRRSIQRLLLFIHAKHCRDAVCQDPQYRAMCPQYKDLFNHTMQCKDNNCHVHHCTSSKYIIAHWSECKDKKSCLTCGNVLEALRKQREAKAAQQSSRHHHHHPRHPCYTHDLMSVFTQTQFRKHFQAIRAEGNVFYTTQVLDDNFGPLLKKLEKLEYGWLFAQPIDAAALDLAHYKREVPRPMDLGKIRERIKQGRYQSKPPSGPLRADIASVFQNALAFNKPRHMVYKLAQEYLALFEEEFDEIAANLSELEGEQRMDTNNCALCGGSEILLEPLVLWCVECGAKIARKANFYVSPMAQNKQTCEACYRRCHNKELKATLQKRVHDHTPDEQWISCDSCNRWFHDICGLVNSSEVRKKKNGGAGGGASSSSSSSSAAAAAAAAAAATQAQAAAAGKTVIAESDVKWTCPLCIYQERCRLGVENPLSTSEYRGAAFLPENRMTYDIERHINTFLLAQMRKRQREQGPDYDSNEFSRVKVRCVSNIERHISEATTKKNAQLFEWLREQNQYRMDFKGRSKMILLFQEHDGVDIVFFAMYVQEYDENTAHGPNRKTCYISYLDSVKYFRPIDLRTQLYYELLLSYFMWVKKRGFTRCYIWACPPNEKNGDDYILYCHPKSQQTPTEDRLRQWYRRLVIEGHARGVVVKCQNLTEAHLRDATDCTSLPYFTGDYWPQFAEMVAKELPKPPASTRRIAPAPRAKAGGGGAGSRNGNGNGHSKQGSAAKATPTGMRRGTRSTETELVGALANQKPRDALLKKLSLKIGSAELRDNFLVIDFFDTCAHCRKFISHGARKWTCHTCNDVIEEHWADYTFKGGAKALPGGGGGGGGGGGAKGGKHRSGKGKQQGGNKKKAGGKSRTSRTPRLVRTTSSGRATRDPQRAGSHELEVLAGGADAHRGKKEKRERFALCEACYHAHAALPVAQQHPAHDPECAHPLTEEVLAPVLQSTVDVDEELSSEIFNEREELLTLCQTNHYQFDQVRRAKHSTMMFLYHIFNPETMREALPATCDECGASIQGAQYRCKTCPDYDMCMNCFTKRVPHVVEGVRHELRLHDPSREPNVFVERRIQQQRAQNRKRLNEILVHTTTCKLGLTWPNACKLGKSCYKVGALLRHWESCKAPHRRQCQQCVVMSPILQHHYKICQNKQCLVPSCTAHQSLYQQQRRPQRGIPRAVAGGASPSAAKENSSRATPGRGGGGGGGGGAAAGTGGGGGAAAGTPGTPAAVAGKGKGAGTTLVLNNKPTKRKQGTGHGQSKHAKAGALLRTPAAAGGSL